MEAKDYTRITVVTPSFNQVQFIEKTILSVLDQDYPNLEYIIIDGGSTDGSIDIVKKYEKQIHYWESTEDKGIYHALNKGFSRSTGEIMCWINSDDILWQNSLFQVQELFKRNSAIHWLQGLPTVIDVNGKFIFQREPVYSKFYFYLRKHESSYSFIQQESTFWSRDLWIRAGGYLDENYKLAADFDLWLRFFELEKLFCTDNVLGAFRMRNGQLSSNKNKYLKEANCAIRKNFTTLRFKDVFRIKLLRVLQGLKKRTGSSFVGSVKNRLESKVIGEAFTNGF